MAGESWNISGEYMESCNCDYLCPCIYTNPQEAATNDNCTALMAFRIDNGKMGDVDLGGVKFALVIRSGEVMADGDWIFACVIDERADDKQRAAMETILGGQAGGVPGAIQANLVGDYRGVQFKAIEFVEDDLRRSVDIPDVLEFEIAGVPSRSGNGRPLYIDNTSHPANTRLALARSKKMKVNGFGVDLELNDQGNNGHFAPFSWSA